MNCDFVLMIMHGCVQFSSPFFDPKIFYTMGSSDNVKLSIQWRWTLKYFEGDGDEKIGVKGVTPQKLVSFGSFVYCLIRTILLFFLIFPSFSIFFSPIFLPPLNFMKLSPSLKILRGIRPPASGMCESCLCNSALEFHVIHDFTMIKFQI